MPRVTLNLSEAQSRKPIPEGTYTVKILEFSGPHKGPKAQYLTVVTEVTDGAKEGVGRKFYDNLPIEGQGAGIFADFLSKATGDDIDVDNLDETDVDTDDLIGIELGANVKNKEYPEGSGEFQSQITKFLKAR